MNDPLWEDLAASAKKENCDRCGRSHLVENHGRTINMLLVIRKDQSKPDYAKGNLITVCKWCRRKDEM